MTQEWDPVCGLQQPLESMTDMYIAKSSAKRCSTQTERLEKPLMGLAPEHKSAFGYRKSYTERLAIRGGGECARREAQVQQSRSSCGRVVVFLEGGEATKPIMRKVLGVPGKKHTFY